MTTSGTRSPELMSSGDTALVVIDVQESLVPKIAHHEPMVQNICRLVQGAKILSLPVLATEQYPKGLKATVSPVLALLPEAPIEKITFSCAGAEAFREKLASLKVSKLLLVGIETHICVQQTALDLLAEGYRIYLAVDAVGSRFSFDHEIALRRMEAAGATLTSTEGVFFEWCHTAGTPEFKQIRQLVTTN